MKKRYLLIFVCFAIFLFVNFVSASNIGLIENSSWQNNLTAVRFSATAMGDLNGDGNDDMVLIGCLPGAGGDDCNNGVISKVYINNGTSLIENLTWEQNLTGVGYGSLALGDIDNDGKLDFALSGCTTGTNWGCNGDIISKIYINNGTSFTESNQWQNNLTGLYDSSTNLGDINNDGYLDMIINGKKSTLPFYNSRIYINNGTSFVESTQWQQNLIGIYGGQISLGDIDNDGKLDLALTGDAGSSDKTSKIYRNNGSTLVENTIWEQNLAILSESTFLFGDYNNDGKLDLVLTGNAAGDFIYIYNNNGTTLILNQTRDGPGNLIGVYFASLAFGDYNNDGDLDLAEIGNEHGYARIYENNQSNYNYFVQDSMAYANISTNLFEGSVTWIDINNDGKLDLIITGYNFPEGSIAKIFINNNTISNTLPTAPNTFASIYLDGVLNLTWNNGSDSETPSTGLYYNLMVGNSTTNNTIISGVYGGSSGGSRSGGASNGYFGNMMQRKNISLNKYLPAGTYYWYVQTIDTGLAKSSWSARQSIVVGADITKPVISNVGSSSITTSTATITWTTDETANSTVYYGTTTSTSSFSGDTELTASHSISLSGLPSATVYYYNVSSCDYWNNCNTSIQYSFTTSTDSTPPGSPGGGGSTGGSSTTPPAIVIPKAFDIDFSTATSGVLETKQGDVKTFSFNSEITHKITATEITTTSAKLIIESEPIVLVLLVGQVKQIDINNDKINDFEIRLISIIAGKAKFSLVKLTGASIVAQEEIEKETKKEALFDVKIGLSNLFSMVKTGRDIIAKIEVLNINNIGQVDVRVDYYITSKEDNTTKLAEGSDTLAVEAVASFARSLTVPYNLKAGNYLFNVDVSYKGIIMASGNTEFIVIKTYEIIIASGVVVLIILAIFVYLWRIRRKEKGLEKKERRDINTLRREIKKLKGRKK